MSLLRPKQIAPEGSDGDILTIVSGVPAFAAPTGGGGGGDGATLLCTPQGALERQYVFASTIEGFTTDGATLAATGGKLRVTGSVGANHTILEPSSASDISDGEVWFDVDSVAADGSGANGFGVVFRAADFNNHYMWGYNFGSGTVQLFKKVSGSYTSLITSTGPTLQALGSARILCRFSGSRFKLYADETLIGAGRDTTFTTGRCGLRSTAVTSSGTLDYDNFTVLSLSTGWTPPSY